MITKIYTSMNQSSVRFTPRSKKISGNTTVTTLKVILALLLVVLVIVGSMLTKRIIHRSQIDQKRVYGSWVEVGAPAYNADVIKINEVGVYKNSHLITTNVDFNGRKLSINTGKGQSVYVLDRKDPNILKRVEPRLPQQQLVKKGYEGTVEVDVSGYMRQKKSQPLLF